MMIDLDSDVENHPRSQTISVRLSFTFLVFYEHIEYLPKKVENRLNFSRFHVAKPCPAAL
jgi:hypothetical protein